MKEDISELIIECVFKIPFHTYYIHTKEWSKGVKEYVGCINCRGQQIQLDFKCNEHLASHFDELCGYTTDGCKIELFDLKRELGSSNTYLVRSIRYKGKIYEKPIIATKENKKTFKDKIKEGSQLTFGCLSMLAIPAIYLFALVGIGSCGEFIDAHISDNTEDVIANVLLWGLVSVILIFIMGLAYIIAEQQTESRIGRAILTIINTLLILLILFLFTKIMEFVFGDIGVINDAHRPDRW